MNKRSGWQHFSDVAAYSDANTHRDPTWHRGGQHLWDAMSSQRRSCAECGADASSTGSWGPRGAYFCKQCWERWERNEWYHNGSWGSSSWTHGADVGWSKTNQQSWFANDWKDSSWTDWWHADDAADEIENVSVNHIEEDGIPEELQNMGYCDAHCHLDYCIHNQKLSDDMWDLKKFMCTWWQQGGRCWYGQDCSYAHGEHELTKRPVIEDVDLIQFNKEHPTEPIDLFNDGDKRGSTDDSYSSREDLDWRRWQRRDPSSKDFYGSCSFDCICVNDVVLRSARAVKTRRDNGSQPVSSVVAAGDFNMPFPPPPPPALSGPRLRCLITNCCESEAIADHHMLATRGDRILGGSVFCTFGCHPHNYMEYDDAMESALLAAIDRCGLKAVGWGECGLDYFKNFYEAEDPQSRRRMVSVFARQARLAASRKLPLVVHTRDAEEDTLAVLSKCVPRHHPVHVHAFQGSVDMLKSALNLLPNAVVGVSGAVLFKYGSTAAREIARHCPLDRLVLETDAPYLSERPCLIPKVAAEVAKIKGISAKAVLTQTNANCEHFYGIRGRLKSRSS